jgi:hypothetical protein
MQMPSALIGKLTSDRARALGEDSLLPVIALPQPDAFASPQIDRRPDLHEELFQWWADSSGQSEKCGNSKYPTRLGQFQEPAPEEEIDEWLLPLQNNHRGTEFTKKNANQR